MRCGLLSYTSDPQLHNSTAPGGVGHCCAGWQSSRGPAVLLCTRCLQVHLYKSFQNQGWHLRTPLRRSVLRGRWQPQARAPVNLTTACGIAGASRRLSRFWRPAVLPLSKSRRLLHLTNCAWTILRTATVSGSAGASPHWSRCWRPAARLPSRKPLLWRCATCALTMPRIATVSGYAEALRRLLGCWRPAARLACRERLLGRCVTCAFVTSCTATLSESVGELPLCRTAGAQRDSCRAQAGCRGAAQPVHD